MKWPLLFLAACGGSDAGLLDLGEASAPETSVSKDATSESSAETSPTGTTTSTDATSARIDSASSTTEASLPESSAKPISDAGSDAFSVADAYDCNLTCEPMCIRLMRPMHACCSPNQQCHCTLAEAGSTCAP